ncbi:MAG: hypothetical protein KatS3mg008_1297 [Acidimicrobiales bacterium]|nr:MAG: hypothetical protein KatS3mg008_1297 [Acidimicrobiales bacterium]
MPTTIQFAIHTEGSETPARELGTCDLRQLHGLACALFEGPDAIVPHDAQSKPFSVGPIATRPGGALEWKTSWLSDEFVPPILGRTVPARLGATPCTLRPLTVHHQSFGALVEQRATAAEIAFVSPTYFSRSGDDFLLPDPHLIFGSLERRWRDTAPAEFDPPEQIGKTIAAAVRVSAVDICTVRTQTFAGLAVDSWEPLRARLRQRRTDSNAPAKTGFVGTISLELTDRGLADWFGALLAFANFSGVGRSTTHGCGAVICQLHQRGADRTRTMSLAVPASARPWPPRAKARVAGLALV